MGMKPTQTPTTKQTFIMTAIPTREPTTDPTYTQTVTPKRAPTEPPTNAPDSVEKLDEINTKPTRGSSATILIVKCIAVLVIVGVVWWMKYEQNRSRDTHRALSNEYSTY